VRAVARATVLLVDDEPDVLTLLRIALASYGFEVVGEAGSGAEAVELWRGFDEPPDVVILDNRMPDLTGLEVAAVMLAEAPDQLIVMCTSIPDGETRRAAAAAGIAACLPKRDLDLLPATVQTLIDERRKTTGA
jgi:CheY-like chemotaxis protein